MSKTRLAIVSTHPIQYYSPVFRAIAQAGRVELKVFYTWSQARECEIFDSGFGASIKWDIPLLDGYAHQFVQNVARSPGLHHFAGLKTPTLASEIEAWQAEVVLVYTWNSRAHLHALRYFKGRLPVLFRGDSTLLDPHPWWRKQLRRAFLTWVYSHIDTAVAVGSQNRKYFTWCGLRPDQVFLAPHSIDTERFAEETTAHAACVQRWRSEMNVVGSSIVILFAGKLQPKKNPGLLLSAFADLKDAHLVFVGNGELEDELKCRAKQIGNVHFLPFQNQRVMPAVYRLGDLFVLPSKGPAETWGLALNEAMASGRPVIASTKVGGAFDLIYPGRNGWMFESDSVDELRALLQRAVDRGKAGLRTMGVLAQQDSGRFSTEESARRISEAAVLARALPA